MLKERKVYDFECDYHEDPHAAVGTTIMIMPDGSCFAIELCEEVDEWFREFARRISPIDALARVEVPVAPKGHAKRGKPARKKRVMNNPPSCSSLGLNPLEVKEWVIAERPEIGQSRQGRVKQESIKEFVANSNGRR